MEINVNSGSNFDGGINSPIYQGDLGDDKEHPPQPDSHHNRPGVSMFNVASGRRSRLAVASLALLAVVLLIVDISLGAHYNKLTDNHLTIDDAEHIENEMNKLQDTYKAAIEAMKGDKKQLDSETSRQTLTNWELEHQTKRLTEYVALMDRFTQDIASMKSRLPMINDGCRHCPAGWFSINSVCYFFAFSNFAGSKTWLKAREFCQMHGGDLVVLDSKDKENSTINILLTNDGDSTSVNGFWIGLRYLQKEGSWEWLDGTSLAEGYWNDGEPTDSSGDREPCAAVYPRENFFKAWSSVGCGQKKKLICEKAPTSVN